MKTLLFFLFLLISITADAQIPQNIDVEGNGVDFFESPKNVLIYIVFPALILIWALYKMFKKKK